MAGKGGKPEIWRGLKVPHLPEPTTGPWVSEARKYLKGKFPDHPGKDSSFTYPVTPEAAQKVAGAFPEDTLGKLRRLSGRSPGQGASSFHSPLSPLLHIGLLTPKQVLETTLDFARGPPDP